MVREDIIEEDFCQRVGPTPPQHHEEQRVAARCVDLLAVVLIVSVEEEALGLAVRDCWKINFS